MIVIFFLKFELFILKKTSMNTKKQNETKILQYTHLKLFTLSILAEGKLT